MRFVLSVAFALIAGFAQAACPGETQQDINDCAAARYAEFDGHLNAVWPLAKSSMDEIGAGVLLLDAQRKWLAYRDAACTAETAPYAGGSIRPLIWYDCLTRITATRTTELRGLLRP